MGGEIEMFVAILSLILAIVLIVPEIAGIMAIAGGFIGVIYCLCKRYRLSWR